jgi:fibronectin type 3 domain-containing protein
MNTKYSIINAAFLLLLVLLAACSTSNEGITSIPERDTSGAFAVTALEGQGTFTPDLQVSEQENAVAVTVTARDAEELSGAFVHVSYDTSRYTPARVELGQMLGGEGQVVSLALTDVSGVVPIGIAQITSSGVAPATGSGELATVYFAAEPFLAPRSVSQSPSGDYNAVDDLQIISQDATTATLRWTEKNVGDYNNDSLVGVADLTPIGQNFNVEVARSGDPLRLGMVDGNKDGFITVSDITQIGQNFGNQISGYRVYKDVDGMNAYGDGLTVTRGNFDSDRSHPIIYTYQADLPPGFVGFTVRPAAADAVSDPGPVSNAAEPVDVPGPPEPPTSLTAVSDSTTGHQTIELNWTASTSTDIATYVVERKRDTDADWGEPLDVGNVTSYTDHDMTFVEGALYLYRVHARDFTELLSSYVELDSPVTPYFTAGPPAPVNAVADNECGVANAIDVVWDAPADDTAVVRYRVYRKAPGESEFSAIFTSVNKFSYDYLDQGLTLGEYYEYYVVSVGSEAESDPSATVGNTPCEEVPEIHITGLQTDKTTHHTSGSEGVSNIGVMADNTPDSVDWSATAGTIGGSGTNVTWEPGTSMSPQKVTVTCTVHMGAAEDTATLDLYVTSEQIQSPTPGTNSFIDFNNLDLLEPLIDGGDTISGRPLSYYVNGNNVVLFNLFGIWCYFCKVELPEFDSWMNTYENEDFYVVLDSDDSPSEMTAYLNSPQFGTPPLDRFNVYCRDGAPKGSYWNDYGQSTGYPHNVLFDRDGFIRKWKVGAILDANVAVWENSIKELLGISG